VLTRYALRTLWGPRLALLLVVLEAANLLQLGRPWRGELLWTTQWLGIVHFIVGPLLAGVAAVDAARLARQGSLELLAVSGRPRGTYVWAAAWTAVPACLAHTAALAVALAWARDTGEAASSDPRRWLSRCSSPGSAGTPPSGR